MEMYHKKYIELINKRRRASLVWKAIKDILRSVDMMKKEFKEEDLYKEFKQEEAKLVDQYGQEVRRSIHHYNVKCQPLFEKYKEEQRTTTAKYDGELKSLDSTHCATIRPYVQYLSRPK
eukprot:UN04591